MKIMISRWVSVRSRWCHVTVASLIKFLLTNWKFPFIEQSWLKGLQKNTFGLFSKMTISENDYVPTGWFVSSPLLMSLSTIKVMSRNRCKFNQIPLRAWSFSAIMPKVQSSFSSNLLSKVNGNLAPCSIWQRSRELGDVGEM